MPESSADLHAEIFLLEWERELKEIGRARPAVHRQPLIHPAAPEPSWAILQPLSHPAALPAPPFRP